MTGRRFVAWHECPHGHQFGVILATMENRTVKCPGCGTITLKHYGDTDERIKRGGQPSSRGRSEA